MASVGNIDNIVVVAGTIAEAVCNGNGGEHQDNDGGYDATDGTPAVEPYFATPAEGLH